MSIANRQEKVFNLRHGLEAYIESIVPHVDSSQNTMLHLAAKLSPPSQLARISGAALQMQRELQWYKEVESIMNPAFKNRINDNNQTARELFTYDHKGLLLEGEQWMKGSATSCTVVGALIITIMFTAAFTVPGGNVQETGYPVFKDEKSFTVFIVADAISLFSSSTSVLMFLGILTSRYAEEDFLKSLPTKLIFGLSTLFLSIAAMMVTFCAALIIMLNGKLEIVIPIVLLASIPVTFFMLLQFPLLVEIFVSTYGPGMFNKKMKHYHCKNINFTLISAITQTFSAAWSSSRERMYTDSNMTTNNRQQQQRFPGHEERFVEAESSQGSGAVSDEMNGPLLTLYKYAHNGDWDAIKNYLSRYPNAKKARIKPYGGTVLHVAAFSGNLKVVEELVKLMSVEELEMQDNQGNTGLSSAAFVGIRKMAECFVSKNRNLVTFVNAQKRIPLVQACISNCKDMALYLYSVTPFEFLCQDNGHHGSYFLQCAIGAQMLDIVFDFLHRFPCVATKTDDVLKSNALIRLSTSPQIFPSICSQPIVASNDTVRIYVPAQSLRESKNIVLQGIKQIYEKEDPHIFG
uniref:PGG domain-containing protein n=1 Tax=Salix viminalis TaxID=40686 RepID=A0A6N2LNF5_SALVM